MKKSRKKSGKEKSEAEKLAGCLKKYADKSVSFNFKEIRDRVWDEVVRETVKEGLEDPCFNGKFMK